MKYCQAMNREDMTFMVGSATKTTGIALNIFVQNALILYIASIQIILDLMDLADYSTSIPFSFIICDSICQYTAFDCPL
jgi:hypothetical protein